MGYDNWLINQAEAHTKDCEPCVINSYPEPQDGEIVCSYEYNCHKCGECACEHWEEYNR